MGQDEQIVYRPPPPPVLRAVSFSDINAALLAGWHDFRQAPLMGLFFGAFYAIGGLIILAALTVYREVWMILPIAIGFPLIGPFVAVGLYEISRRLAAGKALSWPEILLVVLEQRKRQLGWMAFVVLFIFWMWLYQVRILLAIFLGFKSFSDLEGFITIVTTTPEGLGFLAVGSLVGAALSLVLFSTNVIALPLLLERDVDFITAIITSIKVVVQNPVPMIGWGLIVALLAIVSMFPAFLGLIIVLPVLGHATWHLYKRAVAPAEAAQDY